MVIHPMLLIYCILIPSLTLSHGGTIKILYLTDETTPNINDKKEFLHDFQSRIKNISGVSFEQQVIPNNLTTLLPTMLLLNQSITWKETQIIILEISKTQMRKVSLFSSTEVVFDVDTRPFNDDQVFPNNYFIKPSFTKLHAAVRRIFGEIGWTTMAEINCYDHRTEAGLNNMKEAMDSIQRSTSKFIFVKCSHNLEDILRYGYKIGLTNSHFRWVFPGTIQLKNIAEILLPKNVIAIDLPGVKETKENGSDDNSLFLKDVLLVLEKLLQEDYKELINDRKFTRNFKEVISNRSFTGQTGDIIFDEEGRRSGEHYKIFELIHFKGNPQWLPIGSLQEGTVKILFNQWQLDKQPSKEIPVLRVVTILEAPWIIYSSEQHRSSSGKCDIGRICRSYPKNGTTSYDDGETHKDYCCTGLVIEMLDKLEKSVNFRGVVHFVKDGMFGSNNPTTHEWNGMIGELLRGEADMAISVLTITAKRSQVVDFTYPFINAANGILVSTEPAVHTLWDFVFLNTFSVPLWVALFITVQIVIVTLWLAERLRLRRRLTRDPNKRDNSISYAEIINYTYSLVFQKASEEVGPSSLGGRTVAALFAFCTIIACSSFTANLAAIKVSERAGISISGIHDSKFQNPSSDFTFGTFGGSANLDYFRYGDDAEFQRIYSQIHKNLVYSSDEGAENVASRKWTAYIDDIPILNYVISKRQDCTLKVVGAPFFFSGYGIALPKNSTWNAPLSLAITQLIREEVFQDLQSKWLKSACVDSNQPVIEKMGVNDIGGAFLIVAFGCIASCVLLGVEFFVWKLMMITRENNGETQHANRINQAFTPLTKLFTMWDINPSTKPVVVQQHSAATLKHFTSAQQRPTENESNDQ